MNPTELERALATHGYVARRPELLALAGQLADLGGGAVSALLLEGPPGCGKTALAEAAALVLDAKLVAYQAHAWTDADELFVGVNVTAAVAGDAAAVRQPGVLALAAQAAGEGPVVLLIDEVDKAPERAEALLLDALQSGRVPVAPGVHLRLDTSRVLVVLTSNGVRRLGDALLRRCRRVAMTRLPEAAELELLRRTGAPDGLCAVVRKVANTVGEADRATISVSEMQRALRALRFATGARDVGAILESCLARGEAGRCVASAANVAAPVWGELKLAIGAGWRS
jgi:MoxR-like ATPase